METSLRWSNERLVVFQISRNTVPPEHQNTFRVTLVLHSSTVNAYLFAH